MGQRVSFRALRPPSEVARSPHGVRRSGMPTCLAIRLAGYQVLHDSIVFLLFDQVTDRIRGLFDLTAGLAFVALGEDDQPTLQYGTWDPDGG